MAYSVLWLDHDHAQFFHYNPGSEIKKQLKNQHREGHAHHDRVHDEGLKKFYKEVSESLGDCKAVLLVGPGQAKVEFKKYLEEHHQKKLLDMIVGVESADNRLSDGEIRNLAKKFYHQYNLFH